MKKKLVVIGNGMAPGRMLEHLFELAPDHYDVTIFNAEPRVNYDRIMLSPVLSGEKSFDDIIIHGDGWYVKNNVTLYKGHKVINIDRDAKTVTSEHGETAVYDSLVIATGSAPFILPVEGKSLPGVLTYRDLDDVHAMLLAAQSRAKAVVIGGGLLGLEAAAGLREQGMDVTVLHIMPTLMERQLDTAAGYLLQRELENRGIKVICKADTKQILGDRHVTGVELKDGTIIDCTLVVMAAGIRPNAQLAKDAGLTVNRGIVVDGHMRTSDENVLSVGECAEIGGMCYGLVAPLYEQARIAAETLAGASEQPFVHVDTATKLKVTGINLFSIGDFADGPDREEIVLRDASAGVYKRVILRENKIIGTVLYGETADGAWFNDLKKKQTDISAMRETLIFGQSFQGGAPMDPMAAVAALPDDAEICGCNGVCKGKITGTPRPRPPAAPARPWLKN
jgi:nitrite reductase (NADH) large subunit